jgi:hypothetical protein
MKVKLSRPVRVVLLIVATALSVMPMLEVTLRVVDPWGLKYFDDLAYLWENVVAHPQRGYAVPPGTYQFSNWKATILADSTRWLPDNQQGKCKVVFLGDSATWSHGVSDEQTWVNVVAGQLPEANAINAGLNGYNSENVRRAIAEFPDAHLIVYLIVGNDMEPTSGWENGWPYQPRLWMLDKYVRYWQLSRGFNATPASAATPNDPRPPDPHYQRFLNDLEAMSADPRVIFLAIPGFLDPALIAQYDIFVFPSNDRNERISVADPHANADGSRAMATSALPVLQAAMAARCPR